MNNTERSQWIDNDEGLYSWWKNSRQSKSAFIKDNREELDACISKALNVKPGHWRGLDYCPIGCCYTKAPR